MLLIGLSNESNINSQCNLLLFKDADNVLVKEDF